MTRRSFLELLASPLRLFESFAASNQETDNQDVHTEHCCLEHGCKYGDEECSVVSEKKRQSFPCEWCEEGYE